MQWRAVACLLLLVGSVGCLAMPFGEPTPQDEPAPVMLVNNATQTETFTVGVIGEEDNLTIYRRNTSNFNLSPGPGSGTHIIGGTTKIEFPESAQIYGDHTLEPGEQKLVNVTDVAPNEAIVVLVYDEEDQTYRAIKTLSCSTAILGYRVTSQAGGPDDWTMSTHQCSSF